MKRETSNKIRFILEELLPPIIRDSFFFTYIIKKLHRSDPLHFDLKKVIFSSKKNIYKKYYSKPSKIHSATDLSKKCIDKIHENIKGKKILDVGCFDGELIKKLSKKVKYKKIIGIDILRNMPKSIKEKKIYFYKKKLNQINEKFNPNQLKIQNNLLTY